MPALPPNPYTVQIYRTVMEWLEPIYIGIPPRNGPMLRVPLYPRFCAYAPTVSPDQTKMTQRYLCFVYGIDDLGLYAESMGASRRRIYYNHNWRAIADIEEILREESAPCR